MYIEVMLGELLVPFLYSSLQKNLLASQDIAKVTSMKIRPEIRLWYAMLCAPAIPVSLFWMGWTSYVSLPGHTFSNVGVSETDYLIFSKP